MHRLPQSALNRKLCCHAPLPLSVANSLGMLAKACLTFRSAMLMDWSELLPPCICTHCSLQP